VAAAWKPPERYTPSEWAERHRVLPRRSAPSRAGTASPARPTPAGSWTRWCEPGVEEIWFVAGTQIGKTTIQENVLGYWIDNDPGPCLIVKPSEAAVEESVKERWRPLLEASPRRCGGT
jgi:phage terminase large subunit GpA-like protein